MSSALMKISSSLVVVSDADGAKGIVHALVPEWSARSLSNSAVFLVPGGITNRVYHVSNTDDNTTLHALVRIFGAEGIISKGARARENSVFAQLAERHIAPGLLGVFANGRVEQWLHARTISLQEMVNPVVLCGVARAMAHLHAFCPEEEQDTEQRPEVWKSIEGWLNCARHLSQNAEDVSTARLEHEVNGLRHILEQVCTPSEIVFAHNDLLAGNIMVSLEDNVTVHLIDFEYSGMSYRGFDIGNFFCEAMGGTTDGLIDRNRYPSVKSQLLFCRTYLFEISSLAGTPQEPSELAVSNLADEANQYGLLAHLYWTAWALAQSSGSTVDFPYLLFAKQRFGEYLQVKDQYSMPKSTPANGGTCPCEPFA